MLFANYDFTDKPDKWHIVRDKCGNESSYLHVEVNRQIE